MNQLGWIAAAVAGVLVACGFTVSKGDEGSEWIPLKDWKFYRGQEETPRDPEGSLDGAIILARETPGGIEFMGSITLTLGENPIIAHPDPEAEYFRLRVEVRLAKPVHLSKLLEPQLVMPSLREDGKTLRGDSLVVLSVPDYAQRKEKALDVIPVEIRVGPSSGAGFGNWVRGKVTRARLAFSGRLPALSMH